ncbi:hypothetical protein A0H76_2867 [Hepatospora eriocheir]|uniref:Uncharacterized protein n=1 Tax=Hepatospora eriocheir TaxID=1081669 RepID=A0A1X0Q5C4_9MICR|nr:hypothetical protein A0H76_2867 [Hepatospora eriocheir]
MFLNRELGSFIEVVIFSFFIVSSHLTSIITKILLLNRNITLLKVLISILLIWGYQKIKLNFFMKYFII